MLCESLCFLHNPQVVKNSMPFYVFEYYLVLLCKRQHIFICTWETPSHTAL